MKEHPETNARFDRGDRVEFTPIGRKVFGPRERRGCVVGRGRDGTIRVVWDATVTPRNYDPRYLAVTLTARDRRVGVSPGEVLREEFLRPLKLSAGSLARDLGVTADRVSFILHGNTPIDHEIARLRATRLGTSMEFWMNLEAGYNHG